MDVYKNFNGCVLKCSITNEGRDRSDRNNCSTGTYMEKQLMFRHTYDMNKLSQCYPGKQFIFPKCC